MGLLRENIKYDKRISGSEQQARHIAITKLTKKSIDRENARQLELANKFKAGSSSYAALIMIADLIESHGDDFDVEYAIHSALDHIHGIK